MTDSTHGRHANHLTVEPNDSLPDVLNRLRSRPGESVTLTIPDHSPIFLTATEFRTLRDVADQSAVNLTLDTADTLRLQLAAMFGLAERAPRPETPADPTPLPASPSFSNWRKARKDRQLPMEDEQEVDQAEEDPIAVSRSRRRKLYWPGQDDEAVRREPDASLPAGEGALDYLDREPRGGISAKAAGRIVAVLAVIFLLLGISGWYYLPSVTVQATLKQDTVETSMLFSVIAPGAQQAPGLDFSIEGEESSATVEFSKSIPTTGIDSTPVDPARGVVTLRNASDQAVTIPAGTSLAPVGQIAFTTDADVEVPAGSADGSTVGEATVNVTASEPGKVGNLEIGALSGKIEDQTVYFSNREQAMSGGTDSEVKVVAQADIDTLEDAAQNDTNNVVGESWSQQLGDGQSVVISSIQTENLDYSIDQEVGAQADTVTLSGTTEATGLTYDLATVEEQAREQFTPALAALVPEGFELLPETVTLGEPERISEASDAIEYELAASATTQAIFTAEMQDSLADQMAGGSWDEAVDDLSGVSAFASWSLDHSPGFWAKRMPQTPSRIEIEVQGGPGLNATPGAEEPESGT